MDKKKLWTSGIGVLLILIVCLSVIRYQTINKNGYKSEEVKIAYGKEVDLGGLSYKIEHPRIKKVYSKEYSDYVLRYFIPFQAKNKTTATRRIGLEDLVIISAGMKWIVDPFQVKEMRVNKNVKWKLKANEQTNGEMLVEIVIDKKGEGFYTEKVLKDYELYFVEKGTRGGYKYKFID